MRAFALDRDTLVFFCFSLAVACWAVLDTPRFLRLLSYNRRRTFTRFQMMVIRVPGVGVILGIIWLILVTLIVKLRP